MNNNDKENFEEHLKKLNINSIEMEIVLKALLKKRKKLNLKDRATLDKQLRKQEEIEKKLDKLQCDNN
jgi:hypothetical protein